MRLGKKVTEGVSDQGPHLHFIRPVKGHLVAVRSGTDFNPGVVDFLQLFVALLTV